MKNSASKEPFDAMAKVAVIGDSSVGKTETYYETVE